MEVLWTIRSSIVSNFALHILSNWMELCRGRCTARKLCSDLSHMISSSSTEQQVVAMAPGKMEGGIVAGERRLARWDTGCVVTGEQAGGK